MSFFLTYIVPFVIALGLLILVHELGHYLVARWYGVKVLRFSVGFGKPLLKYQGKGETEWVLAAFPLGGYVKMLGESDDEVEEHESHRAFSRQPVGRRFAIVLAGPVFNLLLAVVLYWGVFVGDNKEVRPLIAPTEMEATLAREAGVREGDLVLSVDDDEIRSLRDLQEVLVRRAIDRSEVRLLVRTSSGDDAVRILNLRDFSIDDIRKKDRNADLILHMGLRQASIPTLIEYVEEGGAAARSGMVSGDEIVAIDGKQVNFTHEVAETIHATPGQTRTFTVRRGGEELTFAVTVGAKQEKDGKEVGIIGVRFDKSFLRVTVSYGPVDALARAVRQTWEISALTLKSIGLMVRGELSPKNISGPIEIANIAGETAKHGIGTFVRFLALISISLGILNLLPIPVLDGGHLLYYAAEFIKGGALSSRVVEVGQIIGLIFLFMLMAFALYNDVNHLIF
ncbi:MAG: RIP metalloprotease RseP [Azoarcus sp.]|jgi:regulator of sigma E protease|nr:RIP metalloprotease RseP [Azoarcus sp.]